MKAEETSRGAVAAVSGIGAWLIPAWGCPLCLAAFGGTMSALGLGFMATEAVLTPLTIALLGVALVALGVGARRRRHYGPLALGTVSAALLVGSKLSAEQAWLGYLGLAALLAASVWNTRFGARRPSSAATAPESTGLNELSGGRERGHETYR